MQEPNRYTYSTLRFVPDPARGEYVNIGVIIGSDDTKEWQLRTADNLRRARYIDDNGVLAEALIALNDIGRKLDSYSSSVHELFPSNFHISELWLAEMFEQSRNVVQLSPPAPIVSGDIEDAVDILFEELIIQPQRREYNVTKNTVFSAVRRAYKRKGLFDKHRVIEKAIVDSGSFKGHFDFVVANGRAVQLAQTWSFQIKPDDLAEQAKAWAWTVRDLRENGGEVQMQGRRVPVPAEVEIDVIYVPPQKRQREAFREARKAFEQVSVTMFEMDGAESVAFRAEQLLSPDDTSDNNDDGGT